MPDALGEGWGVAVVAILVTAIIPLLRWVGGKWSAPLKEANIKIARLEEQAIERTDRLNKAEIRVMYLEANLEYCQGELENWRAGRWRAGDGGQE